MRIEKVTTSICWPFRFRIRLSYLTVLFELPEFLNRFSFHNMSTNPKCHLVTFPAPTQKCKRKETWERLRRRQSNSSRGQSLANKSADPWVRRESFKNSLLESSSDPDLTLPRPRQRATRPNCLLLPQSPATSTEALPSPSTSLQLSPSPLGGELCNKSSSAPLLTKQPQTQATLNVEELNKRVSIRIMLSLKK